MLRLPIEDGSAVSWQPSGVTPVQPKRGGACSLVGRKCRARTAVVMEGEGRSSHDLSFTYAPGQTLTVPNFDDDIRIECAPGIHFFITKKEAQEY
jgi:hypothetical protein